MPGTPSGQNHSSDSQKCGRKRRPLASSSPSELRDALLELAALDAQLEVAEPQVEQRSSSQSAHSACGRRGRVRTARRGTSPFSAFSRAAPSPPRCERKGVRRASVNRAGREPLVGADHLQRVDARRAQAGSRLPASAIATASPTAAAKVAVSAGSRRRAAPAGAARGVGERRGRAPTPARAEQQAVAQHHPRMSRAAAPSAMRTPISRERCETDEREQAVDADARQQDGDRGEAGEHAHLDPARRGLAVRRSSASVRTSETG